MNRKTFSMLTLAAALIAGAFIAPVMAGSIAPCNPKNDPTCGNLAVVAPCNPKDDPGCNNLAVVAPCDPKTDPGCKN